MYEEEGYTFVEDYALKKAKHSTKCTTEIKKKPNLTWHHFN